MLDELNYAFTVAGYVGTVAFAFSGVLVGVRRRLDVVSVVIIAMLASHGGGLMRDVFLNQVPAALRDPTGFYIVCTIMMLTRVFGVKHLSKVENKFWFVISDSIGVVAFGITGALVAIDHGLHLFGVAMIAFLMAAGGGLLRDMMLNEFPHFLHSQFYGTTAIVLGVILYCFHSWYVITDMVVISCLVIGMLLRLLAHRYNWQIPRLTDN